MIADIHKSIVNLIKPQPVETGEQTKSSSKTITLVRCLLKEFVAIALL